MQFALHRLHVPFELVRLQNVIECLSRSRSQIRLILPGMLPKARELLAEQCTMSRPVKDVVGLAFERQGAEFASSFVFPMCFSSF